MGIGGLKKFIRENYPDAIKYTYITEFSGEKIAIDISSYFYKYKTIFGDDWFNPFVSLICALKKFDVHAVFIFDGTPPPEKNREKEKRRKAKTDLEDNVMNLSVELDIYKSTQTPTPLLTETMEKIMKSNQKVTKVNRLLHAGKKKDTNDNYIDVEAIEDYIKKKEKQIVNISKEEIDDIKKMLTLFGVPYIQAPGEAEALASYLSSKGKVRAVLTEDTDILTYGTEVFLSDFNISSGSCETILLSDVLESMEYTMDEFRDFCIMCGTDYNDNIPNYACKKVFKIINDHRSIDVFIEKEEKKKNPLDYKVLNHKRSRELFQTYGELKVSEEGKEYNPTYWETNVNFDDLYDFLVQKKCRFSPNSIESLWKSADIVFDDDEEDAIKDSKEEVNEVVG